MIVYKFQGVFRLLKQMNIFCSMINCVHLKTNVNTMYQYNNVYNNIIHVPIAFSSGTEVVFSSLSDNFRFFPFFTGLSVNIVLTEMLGRYSKPAHVLHRAEYHFKEILKDFKEIYKLPDENSF